jgi:hypothetical protein
MTKRQPRYSKEEFARRGKEFYENTIRPHVEANHMGKIVAIDIETGEYEMDADQMAACDRLHARLPDAQIFCLKIGQGWVHRYTTHAAPRST